MDIAVLNKNSYNWVLLQYGLVSILYKVSLTYITQFVLIYNASTLQGAFDFYVCVFSLYI